MPNLNLKKINITILRYIHLRIHIKQSIKTNIKYEYQSIIFAKKKNASKWMRLKSITN